MKVLLDKVIDAIESASEEEIYYYDPSSEDIDFTDDPDFIEENEYICLPSQYDRHDYEIMQDYIETVDNEEARDWLTNAIRGRGAFRMFRATVDRFGLTSDWYDYRASAYREIAIDWCNDNGIEFDDGRIIYDEETEEEYMEPSPSLPDIRVININKKNAMNILYMVADKNVFVNKLNDISSSQDLEEAESELDSLFNENTNVFAASMNGKLLGYAVTVKQNDCLLLQALFVRKEDRRQGIGSMLFEHAEEIANEEDLPLIHQVSPKNEYYFNFLKKRGYSFEEFIQIKK